MKDKGYLDALLVLLNSKIFGRISILLLYGVLHNSCAESPITQHSFSIEELQQDSIIIGTARSFENVINGDYYMDTLYIPSFELHQIKRRNLVGESFDPIDLPYDKGYPVFFEVTSTGRKLLLFDNSDSLFEYRPKKSELLSLFRLPQNIFPNRLNGDFFLDDGQHLYCMVQRQSSDERLLPTVKIIDVEKKTIRSIDLFSEHELGKRYVPLAELPVLLSLDDNVIKYAYPNDQFIYFLNIHSNERFKEKQRQFQELPAQGLTYDEYGDINIIKSYIANHTFYINIVEGESMIFKILKKADVDSQGYYDSSWEIHMIGRNNILEVTVPSKKYNMFKYIYISDTTFALTWHNQNKSSINNNLYLSIFNYPNLN